jgi:hypothetical protein
MRMVRRMKMMMRMMVKRGRKGGIKKMLLSLS